ncbi:MAG: hypothetical protein ABSB95_15115 [Dissulfurispiraceae bacterium]|jgi:hypothetical protein
MKRLMSFCLVFTYFLSGAGAALGTDVCPKGEKRLHPGEECIPAQLFNYLYCLEYSGGGKVEITRTGSTDDAKSLEIQLAGKGSGVILKGEGSGKFTKANTTKTTREIHEKLDPTLTANCKSLVNPVSKSNTHSHPKPQLQPVVNSTRTTSEKTQTTPTSIISAGMKGPDTHGNDSLTLNTDCPEITVMDFSKIPPESRIERRCSPK